MSWYLSLEGAVTGPHEEETVLSMIARGGLRNAQIRDAAVEGWQPIDSHPPFADALRRQSPTIRMSRPPRP
jgi:hypothetical protein